MSRNIYLTEVGKMLERASAGNPQAGFVEAEVGNGPMAPRQPSTLPVGRAPGNRCFYPEVYQFA